MAVVGAQGRATRSLLFPEQGMRTKKKERKMSSQEYRGKLSPRRDPAGNQRLLLRAGAPARSALHDRDRPRSQAAAALCQVAWEPPPLLTGRPKHGDDG